MIQMAAIVLSIGAFVWSFFSPVWAWTPLVAGVLWLGIVLWALKQQKWKHIEELSPVANELLQRFGHFYTKPFAGRDASAATSTLQFAAVAVSISCAVQGFWWGLAIAAVFWFGLAPVAFQFNPTHFLKDPIQQAAHQEVISWIQEAAERGRSA